MNKQKIAGFTLAEVLLGLLISSWALLLMTHGLHAKNHQQTIHQTTTANYVAHIEQLLQSDVWQFAVKTVTADKVILTATAPNTAARQMYELHQRRRQLVLTQAKQGHIVIAYDVTKLQFAYRNNVLTLKITLGQRQFVIQQVLPKAKED